MNSKQLVVVITEQNPEHGNKILQKYFKKKAVSADEMKAGLFTVLTKGGANVLPEFIAALPYKSDYSNCDGCGGKCGAKLAEANNSPAGGSAANNMYADGSGDEVKSDFLSKHGNTLIISATIVLAVYLATRK